MGRKNCQAMKHQSARPKGILGGRYGSSTSSPLKSHAEHFHMSPQNDKHAAPHFTYNLLLHDNFDNQIDKMTPDTYLQHIKPIFQENGNHETALDQMKYMRHQFEYYGLKAQVWIGLLKDIFNEKGVYSGEELITFSRLCMEDEYREINYAGLQMLEKQMKKNPEAFIHFYEELIQTKSWWDTVDWIRKMVGVHFQRFPHLIIPFTEKWMASDNIWLQRICFIFQLTYKEKTEFALMKKYILQLAGSKEFFIQKGAGWALRQYSKTDAEGVVEFINANPQLSSLTKREGMKWLLSRGMK